MKVHWTGTACLVLLVSGTAHAAVSAQQKCEQSKLKAQGKLETCLKKNAARMIGGALDASEACRANFQTALTKADTKATAAATSCRYMDNGDGTVHDLDTGLVWEQKNTAVGSGTDLTNPHDVDNRYSWSSGGNNQNGTAFADFLYRLNGGSSLDGAATDGCFAGHCDWRLPTIEELRGILLSDCGSAHPCIDATFGPTQNDAYWSTTTWSSDADNAFAVFFMWGNAGVNGKTSGMFVRAVRAGL